MKVQVVDNPTATALTPQAKKIMGRENLIDGKRST